MFKRYLPGTKKSAFKTPTIRPIEIGFMKCATFNKKISGPLFRKKQLTNSTPVESAPSGGRVYGEGFENFNRPDKKRRDPPFDAPRGEDIYQQEAKGTPGRRPKTAQSKAEQPTREKRYKEGWRAYNQMLSDKSKQQTSKLPAFEPVYIPGGKDIPSHAKKNFQRVSMRGRPPGSLNKTTLSRIKKTGFATPFEDKSREYLSGHATGKYRKNKKPGKPMTVRVMSKFGTHYEYPKDPQTGKYLKDDKGKLIRNKVEARDVTLNWTHLAPFHSYGGKSPRSVNEDSIYSPESRGLRQDSKRRAKLPGFRISSEGQRELHAIKSGRSQWTIPQVLREHGYYEYRRNRADAKPGRTTRINVAGKDRKFGSL